MVVDGAGVGCLKMQKVFEAFCVLFLLRRNFLRNTMGCDREVVRKATNFVGFIRSRFSIRVHSKKMEG